MLSHTAAKSPSVNRAMRGEFLRRRLKIIDERFFATIGSEYYRTSQVTRTPVTAFVQEKAGPKQQRDLPF
jgi:hypothetical protein